MILPLAFAALGLAIFGDNDPASVEARFRVLYGLDKIDAYALLLETGDASDAAAMFIRNPVLVNLIEVLTERLQSRDTLEGLKEDLDELEAILCGWARLNERLERADASLNFGLRNITRTRLGPYLPNEPLREFLWNTSRGQPGVRAEIPVFADYARLARDHGFSLDAGGPHLSKAVYERLGEVQSCDAAGRVLVRRVETTPTGSPSIIEHFDIFDFCAYMAGVDEPSGGQR